MVLKKSTKGLIRSRKSRDIHYYGIKEKGSKRLSEAVNCGTDNTIVLKKSTKEVMRSRKSREKQYNGIKEKVQKR
jgi:hypothetical protein